MRAGKGFLAFVSILMLSVILCQCTAPNDKDIEFNQGYDSGKVLYANKCASCHNINGRGMGTLYPPLAQSDYLKSNIDQLPCIVLNGQKGKMTVNGLEYNWEMPANKDFDEIEMSVLLTYIRNTWGGKKGLVTYKEARRDIDSCHAFEPKH